MISLYKKGIHPKKELPQPEKVRVLWKRILFSDND
jgi:hypothetical protein